MSFIIPAPVDHCPDAVNLQIDTYDIRNAANDEDTTPDLMELEYGSR